MLRIEMLPAAHGDCLWIEYGSGTNVHRILIDGGYRMDTVTPVDQFRYSAHIELVGVFRRAKKS